MSVMCCRDVVDVEDRMLAAFPESCLPTFVIVSGMNQNFQYKNIKIF